MKISIGSDHRGFPLKEKLKEFFSREGIEVSDFGTDSEKSTDYPDYADLVSRSVVSGGSDYGVLICGSGIGISIAANRHKGIRAVNANTPELAEMSRRHNNANVICFGGDFIDFETAVKLVKIFISSDFEGGERHNRRINKLDK